MIYFIQSGNSGPIKIGYSRNPVKRLKQLQTASPNKLHLLLTIKGNYTQEKELHDACKQYHLQNEWFHPAKEILKFIEECKTPNKQVAATKNDEYMKHFGHLFMNGYCGDLIYDMLMERSAKLKARCIS